MEPNKDEVIQQLLNVNANLTLANAQLQSVINQLKDNK